MARIIHTGDWHVGRDLLGCDRHSDHQDVLTEICEIVEANKPDLVIHAGDLFDLPRPAAEDLQLAIDALQRISDVAPTLVLLGNHDSPAYFRLFNTVLRGNERLRFVIHAKPADQGGIVDYTAAGGQRIRVAPVPFIHQNRQIDWFGDPDRFTGDYARKIALINEALAEGLADGYDPARDVLIYAAHLYVAGAHRVGTGERDVHVTKDYAAQPETLPHASYAAFGHIHKHQKLPGGRTGGYCGSTLQLDFGEEGERKSLVLVEANPGQPAQIELIELNAGRPLMTLRGTLEELEQRAEQVGQAIVKLVIDTDEPIPDLADRAHAILPEAAFADLQQAIASTQLESLDASELDEQQELGIGELFERYLTEKGTREADAELVRTLFTELESSEFEEEQAATRIASVKELLEAPLPDPPPEAQPAPEPINRAAV
jgi:exonuclease SbcD